MNAKVEIPTTHNDSFRNHVQPKERITPHQVLALSNKFGGKDHDFLITLKNQMIDDIQKKVEIGHRVLALTCGGSEFFNGAEVDLDACLHWIADRLNTAAKIAKERNELQKRVEELESGAPLKAIDGGEK